MELNMTEDTNRQFKPLIQDKGLPELKKWMADHGEPAYRAGQVFSWVHGKQVTSFDAMTNLSKSLRTKLAEDYDAAPLAMVQRQVSETDGTNKFLYRLRDGQCIETVFMPYHHGNSVCVSSQAGCSMGCTFCASTIGGKVRDLTRGEILAQVYETQRLTGEPVSNVVGGLACFITMLRVVLPELKEEDEETAKRE